MLFSAIQTSGTGLTVNRAWLDAISDNISNINTAKPTSGEAFRARYLVAQANSYGGSVDGNGGGVHVAGVQLGDPNGRVVNDPSNPMADADGNVRMPDIDLGEQMTQLLIAQR